VLAETRQVLRYPGSKTRIADWIASHFPPHDSYLEPFCGSAVVLFAKPRCQLEMINDRDGRVGNFFRVMRDQPEELARLVELTPWSREEYEESQEDAGTDLERARRFLVRCTQGFNGATSENCGWLKLCRPEVGAAQVGRWKTIPQSIREVAHRLRGVQIEDRPALDVIRWANDPAVLIYADPPYLTGGGRYAHEMSEADHEELADALQGHRGPVFLSAYQNSVYEKRLRDWTCVARKANVLNALVRHEVLWLNPKAAREANQQRLELL
jgi:DNA adenine methylase